MRAYLDSGIFIDYLIGRGHAGTYLRAADRRGRSPAQLGEDAEASLTLLATNHEAMTSCLTCYEVEEAMYRKLKSSTSGVPNANKYLIVSARPTVIQTLRIIENSIQRNIGRWPRGRNQETC
jgi:hypothetical protein